MGILSTYLACIEGFFVHTRRAGGFCVHSRLVLVCDTNRLVRILCVHTRGSVYMPGLWEGLHTHERELVGPASRAQKLSIFLI